MRAPVELAELNNVSRSKICPPVHRQGQDPGLRGEDDRLGEPGIHAAHPGVLGPGARLEQMDPAPQESRLKKRLVPACGELIFVGAYSEQEVCESKRDKQRARVQPPVFVPPEGDEDRNAVKSVEGKSK